MKVKSILFLACVFMLCTPIASAQRVKASKKYVTTNVKTERFDSIVLQGSSDITFTQKKGEPSVEIYGSDNIIPLLETVVENKTLYIRFKKNTNIRNIGTLKIGVTNDDLKGLKIQGSGDVRIADGLETESLSLEVYGSGDIKGKSLSAGALSITVKGSGDVSFSGVRAGSLKVQIHGSGDISLSDAQVGTAVAQTNGSGDISLSGTGGNASFATKGSGDIEARNFVVAIVNAEIRGSGDISCHATDKLTGKVSGSGEISYKGDPEISFAAKGLRKL